MRGKNGYIVLRIFILLITLTFVNSVFSQKGWQIQNPLPSAGRYEDIQRTNNQTILICGSILYSAKGILLKTTDNGVTWISVYQGGYRFLEMSFANPNTGYIYSSIPDKINKTTDGGYSWTSWEIGNNKINCMKFLDENTGVAGCENGTIIRTTNGGLNWLISYAHPLNWPFYSMCFINNLTGFVGAYYGNVAMTTNGGLNWLYMYDAIPSSSVRCIFFVDNATGFAGCWNGLFYRTTNTGASWEYLYNLGATVNSIYFINSQTGFAAEDHCYVDKTTDAGASWTRKLALMTEYDKFTGIKFTDSLNGIVSGTNNLIYRTTNCGENWIPSSTGIANHLSDVYFINADSGYTIGDNFIMKTVNGGINWSFSSMLYQDYPKELTFTDYLTGYLIDSQNKLWKTTDGANNWNMINFGNNYNIKSTSILSDSFCTAAGYKSGTEGTLVLKSDDGFGTWQEYVINDSAIAETMAFYDENTGFLLNSAGNMFKSTNGGMNWFQIATGFYSIDAISFVNSNTGFITQGSYALKTTNGGTNWFFGCYTGGSEIKDINVINENLIYVVAHNGIILRSSNCGVNWSLQGPGIYIDFNSVFFANEFTGYCVGDYGTILKTTNGGAVFVNSSQEIIPENYYLSQNYPNPFNSMTSIRFQVPKAENVRIELYDILGRKVKTILDEFKPAGTYEIKLNASDLASGIYFYKLKASDFTEAKSMVVIK